jgi:hypothetical protein
VSKEDEEANKVEKRELENNLKVMESKLKSMEEQLAAQKRLNAIAKPVTTGEEKKPGKKIPPGKRAGCCGTEGCTLM